MKLRALAVLGLAVFILFGTSPYLATPQQSIGRWIEAGDLRYRMLLELPDTATPSPPLVLALHGYGGNIEQLYEESALSALTLQGYGVLWLQGLPDDRGVPHWNAGMTLTSRDDVSALVVVLRQIQRQFGFDPLRTYVIGFSNGGFMAYSLACRTEGVIAGFVTVGASMSGADWRHCSTIDPAPVMHIVGLADDVVPVDGGMSAEDGWGGAPNADLVNARWAARADATMVSTQAVPPALTFVQHETPAGRLIVLRVDVAELAHDWPEERYIQQDILPHIAAFLQTVAMQLHW